MNYKAPDPPGPLSYVEVFVPEYIDNDCSCANRCITETLSYNSPLKNLRDNVLTEVLSSDIRVQSRHCFKREKSELGMARHESFPYFYLRQRSIFEDLE